MTSLPILSYAYFTRNDVTGDEMQITFCSFLLSNGEQRVTISHFIEGAPVPPIFFSSEWFWNISYNLH